VSGEKPAPRSGHDAAFLDDREALLVFGGASDQGELADVWLLESA
jgi:hypothetical protein